MKCIIQYLMTLAFSVVLFGCTDEPLSYSDDSKVSLTNHELYVWKDNINFSAKASYEQSDIEINTNNTTTKWEISGVPDWLKLTETSGNMSRNVLLTAENNLTVYPREAVLKVTSSDMPGSYEIRVSQQAEYPEIRPSEEELYFIVPGETQTVNIVSNCEWYPECYSSWVDCEKKSETELSITVAPNKAGWRSATVYLKEKNGMKCGSIDVYQDGEYY